MLGFGKKKNKNIDKDKNSLSEDPGRTPDEIDSQGKKKSSGKSAKDQGAQDSQNKTPIKSKSPKKKRFSVKLILIIFFILCLGAGGFVVYSLYFSSGSDSNQNKIYKKLNLTHIQLPEEILKFSFDYFPELYGSMITANKEINLIEKEIVRIEAVSTKYPDQAKIADKEKKIWVKAKDILQKSFIKIEKPVKETYVLYQVNRPAGLARVEELNSQLTEAGKAALVTVQDLTKRLKSNEAVPDGFIQKYIYKIKKKFL